MVLQNIWDVHKAIYEDKDKAKVMKMATSLGLKISMRDTQSADLKVLLRAFLGQWLPISHAVLNMVCLVVPSPARCLAERLPTLLFGQAKQSLRQQALPIETQEIIENIKQKKADKKNDDDDVLIFITKLVPVAKTAFPARAEISSDAEKKIKREELIARRKLEGKDLAPALEGEGDISPTTDLSRTASQEAEALRNSADGFSLTTRNSALPTTDESKQNNNDGDVATKGGDNEEGEDEKEDSNSYTWVAFARIFSGTIKPGSKVHVLLPKYNPAHPELHRFECPIEGVFLFMGRDMVALDHASAGAVVGLTGLSKYVLKSATLASSPLCPTFAGMYMHVKPIVRVALETARIDEMAKLVAGMRLLSQADPCAEVYLQETGEHVLVAAGEVHIERCLTDLRELFCPGVEIKVSPPIIPFRETIIAPPKVDMLNEQINELNIKSEEHQQHYLFGGQEVENKDGVVTLATANKRWALKVKARPMPATVMKFIDQQAEILKESGETPEKDVSKEDIVAGLRENLEQIQSTLTQLFDEDEQDWPTNVMSLGPRGNGPNLLCSSLASLAEAGMFSSIRAKDTSSAVENDAEIIKYTQGLIVGFQLTTQSGPLCEEPMRGVVFEIIDIVKDETVENFESGFNGQVIATMKECCRLAFLVQPARLMMAMYACDLVVPSVSLGKVYNVLNKRNSQILSEEMKEGSDSFSIKAAIPVTESFGFAAELRTKTSGLAMPQLVFSHWEVVPMDPFWVPSTTEELLHFGEKADAPNVAKKLMESVRKRKGLYVEEKVVEHAEKQRTLGRKK